MATSATTMTTASTASNVASVLKRPTTLALRTKSAPRNPKCSFLSSNKCLYHNTTASSNSGKKRDWSERKSNIFVKLTSLRKDTAGGITSVALKATVSKRDSCDLEADKVKDEVTIVNSTQCKFLCKFNIFWEGQHFWAHCASYLYSLGLTRNKLVLRNHFRWPIWQFTS